MKGIYISYSRYDAWYARPLLDVLREYYGQERVLYDMALGPGLDVSREMARMLEECAAVVVVIGTNWLRALNSSGERRLDDPDNLVRLEIATAFSSGKLVVPVLVGGASRPSLADLPEDLRPLASCDAFVLGGSDWDADIKRNWDADVKVVLGVLDASFGGETARAPYGWLRNHLASHPNAKKPAVEALPVPASTPPPETRTPPEAKQRPGAARPAGRHNVFVSHAQEDKALTKEVVAALEAEEGLRCWVSYRDIPPGASAWSKDIVHAISASRLVVIVLTKHSFDSEHVLREIALADKGRIPFIGFCVEDAPLPMQLEYYFVTSQRLDAAGLPQDEAVALLTASVTNFMTRTA